MGDSSGPPRGHHGFLAGRGFNNRQRGMLQVSLTCVIPDSHRLLWKGKEDCDVKVRWVRAGQGAELCCSHLEAQQNPSGQQWLGTPPWNCSQGLGPGSG